MKRLANLLVIGCIAGVLLTSPSIAEDMGSISCGETRSGAIATVGEQDMWTSTASAGDRIIVSVVETSGSLYPYVILYAPDGSEEISGYRHTSCQVSQTGTYTVVIHDGQDSGDDGSLDDTGEYNITLLNVGGCSGNAISSNETLSGTIDAASDMEVWQFSVSAGNHIILNVHETSGDLYTTVSVYAPDGSREWTFSHHRYWQVSQTGTYTVLVCDGQYDGNDKTLDDTGEYSITFLNLDDDSWPTISCNQTRSGTIDAVTDAEVWKFSAVAYDHVMLSVVGTSGSLPDMTIYAPDGDQEARDDLLINRYMGQTGTYTVVIDGSLGEYNITLLNLDACSGSTIPCNETRPGTIDATSDMEVWQFFASDGEHLSIRVVETSGSLYPYVMLYPPNHAGELRGYRSIDWDAERTGTYTVVVCDGQTGAGDIALDDTGGYEITVTCGSVVSTYSLSISSTAGGSVTVPGEGSYAYTSGSSVSIIAVAEADHHFTGWTGTAVTAGKVADPGSTSTTVTVDSDYTLQAGFGTNMYTLIVNAVNGTVAATPEKLTYNHGETVTLQAVPNTGYHFTDWSGDLTGSTNPTTITMDGNKAVTANFGIRQWTLTVSASFGGAVTTPGQGTFSYDHGTTLTVVAAAAADHHFVNWTGTAVDTGKVANPAFATTTVSIDADYTLQANFAPDQCTLTVSATAGGAVIAPGEGTFEYGDGEAVVLHAQPDPLFLFVGWRGSISTSANPYSLTMDADLTIKAHFESVLDVLYADDDSASDPGPRDPNVSDPQEDGTPEHPFDSVQEAIEVAKTGTRIMVRSGIYFETVNLLGKRIEVNGLNDDDPNIMPLPVIDGGGKDTVVRCGQGEDPNCVLCGLVITGGKGWQAGGILCVGSSPTILNCLIVGNRTMSLDTGGGIHCQDSNAVFLNCTISGNRGGSAGAGVCFSQSNAMILDSIVWENAPTQIRLLGPGNSVIAYTDVAGGWPGDGILDVDPLFVQPGCWADPANIAKPLLATDPSAVWVAGDYHLMSQASRCDPISGTWIEDPITSPCIDAGDPDSPTGQEPLPNGDRINLGVYGGTRQASLSASGR